MKSHIQFKHLLGVGFLMLCLVTAGCLLTTITKTIVFYTDGPITIKTPPGYGQQGINLEENEDWLDNKDRIKSVESVEFALEITNNTASEATGQVYISDNGSLTTPEEIQDSAILILDGIVMAVGETKVIEREESVSYLQNVEQLLDVVEGGVFYAYGISQTPNFNMVIAESLAVIVTFTADAE